MTNVDNFIQLASQAMREQRFADADSVLQEGIRNCDEPEEREIILQHLVHLYANPLNRNFDKAELYMSERESLNPSAYTALANTYFQLYSKLDYQTANRWAEIASQRALNENDLNTLYSATSVVGLLAAKRGDEIAAKTALNKIEDLIGKTNEIYYSDAIVFLESLKFESAELTSKAKRLAGLIAGKIEDADFRARAEAAAKVRR